MKSMTILLCCALVAGVANAQSTASSAPQPEQSQVLAAPGPAASDVEVADFFVACASANLDESTDTQILSLSDKSAVKSTDKNTNMQLSKYYFLSAVAYSNREYAKSRFIAMRNATKEHVQGKISNGKDLLTILKEELNYDESQNALCTFYTGKYNAKITAHVKQSGVLNGGSTKPN